MAREMIQNEAASQTLRLILIHPATLPFFSRLAIRPMVFNGLDDGEANDPAHPSRIDPAEMLDAIFEADQVVVWSSPCATRVSNVSATGEIGL